MEHIQCKWDVQMGKIIEFVSEMKGFKTTLFTLALAIFLQVGTFLFLWGGLTTTVKNHENNINKILVKLDKVKIVYARGEQGMQGEKGDKGDRGERGQSLQ